MPKEAELKSMQFPLFTSLARRTFWSFPLLLLFWKKNLSALRYTVNYNAHGGAELVKEREGCGRAYICLCASMCLLMFFLDQDIGLKIWCISFPSGSTFITSNIIISFLERRCGLSICIWLSFICLLLQKAKDWRRKGELTDSKWLDLWPLILNGFW